MLEQVAIRFDGMVEASVLPGRFSVLLQRPWDNEGELTPGPGGDVKVIAREGGVVSMSVTSALEAWPDVKFADALAVTAEETG